ncbi:xylulokinase [Leucobacter komagatae]|uniref:Xylulose kinase n=1 Tax=Leucobacter komagatae TaxID=55969 RepID=A0A0D0IPW4_9MICO|nr:xylulokinase [Leucobacter komagatae]KIP51503.1 carbohydrate kinase [Leucobacter komagatae]
MAAVIGIDIGTSGCKTIAVDESGRLLASSSAGYRLYSERAGWAEQDPTDWWDSAVRTLTEVAAALAGAGYDQAGTGPTGIAGIGLSGQMHGLVGLDDARKVIRRAILWNDQRCAAECDEITEEVGGLARLIDLTNNRMLPGFTGGKVRWLRRHEPETYQQLRYLCLPKDYLRLQLTGVFATDESDASGTGFFDPRTREWVPEVFVSCGVEASMLPPIVGSTDQTGMVHGHLAAEIGLPQGVAVFGGGGDSVIQTTSMGVVEPGDVGITLGTAGVVATLTPFCPENADARIQVSAGNEPGRFHTMGVALSAAGAFQWLGEVVAQFSGADNPDFDALTAIAAEAPLGCDGLLFMPYLNGERSPHVAPEATASFVGLSRKHQAGHLARAVIEGALLNLRRILGEFELVGIPCERIIASGGATKGKLWLSILADVCNREVVRLRGSAEGGAFGAVLSAGVGAGVWRDYETALAGVEVVERITPEPARVALYERIYEVHAGLFSHFSDVYRDLQKLNE